MVFLEIASNFLLPLSLVIITAYYALHTRSMVRQTARKQQIFHTEKKLECFYCPLQNFIDSYMNWFANVHKDSIVVLPVYRELQFKINNEMQPSDIQESVQTIIKNDEISDDLNSINSYKYLSSPELDDKLKMLHEWFGKYSDDEIMLIRKNHMDYINEVKDIIDKDIKSILKEHDEFLSSIDKDVKLISL